MTRESGNVVLTADLPKGGLRKGGPDMKQVRFYEMRPVQIRAVRDAFPVAYLPMGTLEWHGEHNPVGLDALKATAMAEKFAERIGGLVMPTVWWGDHRERLAEVVFDEKTSGNFDHRPGIAKGHGLPLEAFLEDAKRSAADGGWKTFEAVLRNTFYELTTLGFRVIVAIAGHYPLIGPAKNAADAFAPTKRAKIIPIIGYDLVKDRFTGDHAARWETSLMLYLRPELVDMNLLDPNPKNVPIGVLGVDPRGTASAEYGREGMEAMTEALRIRVHEALEEVRKGTA